MYNENIVIIGFKLSWNLVAEDQVAGRFALGKQIDNSYVLGVLVNKFLLVVNTKFRAIFLGQFCPRRISATRLTIHEAPAHRPDYNTGKYFLRPVCGFYNVPQSHHEQGSAVSRDLWFIFLIREYQKKV